MKNKIPEQKCTRCGYKTDETTDPFTDHAPYKGCVSMCLACGFIQIFNADLTLRDPTIDERLQILKDPRVTDLQMARAVCVGDKLKTRTRHD